MPDLHLRRDERLRSSKQIQALFTQGHKAFAYPILARWMIVVPAENARFPVRVAFSVSRKRWHRAVDRNKVRRRMREAYRHQKHLLYNLSFEGQVHVNLIYTAGDFCTFEQIHHATGKILSTIAKGIQ